MDETIRLASSWNVEGLILLGVQPQEIEKIREWSKMPVVYIDSYYPEKDVEFDNVGIQDYEGSYEMTRYLIRQGHTKIAFLADGKPLAGVDYERYRGYCDALRDHMDLMDREKSENYHYLPFEKIFVMRCCVNFAGSIFKIIRHYSLHQTFMQWML